ncbi:uncharacterized protein LOC119485545 [Sebastes umbrosus]|uniref:uncharacterized protein LOC119485545 n=1 Tax=Sebastes umbrosus TaxID=72105 RepID=UPI00189EDFAA|nr:uncharacterized protein LOC119485545 [Sebastes umbrosus]
MDLTEVCQQSMDVISEDEQTVPEVQSQALEDEQPSSQVADKDVEDEQTLPETPPCSEEEEEEENKENNVDGVDGWMAGWIVDSIKSAVYHLLSLAIRKYRVDECYGCQISHPSQRNHACLEVLEEDFLQDHYEHLMKRLNTPCFIPSIQRLLRSRNVNMDDLRVRMVAETLLHELKTVKCRWEALSDACENLTGEDTEKLKQLQTTGDSYNDH